MRDTLPVSEEIRLAAVRRMAPAARLRQALDLSEWVRRLALAALRQRHPERNDVELVELLLGERRVPTKAP